MSRAPTSLTAHPSRCTSFPVVPRVFTKPVLCSYDCNGTNAQKWAINRGQTSVQVAGTNYCLDATSGTPANGTPLKIWECYSGLAAQTWYYTDDNRIAVMNGGQCLDLTNGSKNDGTIMQTWACTTNDSNQAWTT